MDKILERIVVVFKESYKPHEVKRTCTNMSKNDVIRCYALNESDIEYYRFVE